MEAAENMRIPRLMIAAAASGSGKTVVSCGLMQALKEKNLKVVSAKCGPDYIDPMFHKEVLGVEAENLDLFFCSGPVIKSLFAEHAKEADIAVIEGVMGYYDGLAVDCDMASSYDVAKALEAPVILVVRSKGMALSILAVIKGMIEFRSDSNIKGILLNQVSSMLYPRLKEMIEIGLRDMGYSIPVVGYVPEAEVFELKSRHLGLISPAELTGIRQQMAAAGQLLAETVDLGRIIEIAKAAPALEALSLPALPAAAIPAPSVKVGLAKDDAFGFYYQDNLNLLRHLGCELVEFSPLKDSRLPEGISGLLLGGGYPEIYAPELERNAGLRAAIKGAIADGLPCLAECGGFMYLQERLQGVDGHIYEMVGAIAGQSMQKEKLVRFGYINITALSDGAYLRSGEQIRGHEFHYWDSNCNGESCLAEKPSGSRPWQCIHMDENLFAGYPHLHYYSNPELAKRFVQKLKNDGGRKL